MIHDVIGATVAASVASAAESRCLSGRVVPAPEAVADALGPAVASLNNYLTLAGTSQSFDASPAFTRKSKLREVWRDDRQLLVQDVDDPLARALASGKARLGGPLNFIRSGDARTALGSWRVSAEDEVTPDGHYLVLFRKEGEEWKITRLELLTRGAPPPIVAHYCHVPGDIEAHMAQVAEIEAERERKRAEKAVLRGLRY